MKLAAVACFAALHAAQGASAAELGRLFHTPEQRRALEAARANPKAVHQPKPAPLEGYVVRSDGLSTVWIAGRAEKGSGPFSSQKRVLTPLFQ